MKKILLIAVMCVILLGASTAMAGYTEDAGKKLGVGVVNATTGFMMVVTYPIADISHRDYSPWAMPIVIPLDMAIGSVCGVGAHIIGVIDTMLFFLPDFSIANGKTHFEDVQNMNNW